MCFPFRLLRPAISTQPLGSGGCHSLIISSRLVFSAHSRHLLRHWFGSVRLQVGISGRVARGISLGTLRQGEQLGQLSLPRYKRHRREAKHGNSPNRVELSIPVFLLLFWLPLGRF